MRFKYLHLKKSRELVTNDKVAKLQYPGRRKFVKAMGLSALAWTPVVNSLKTLHANTLVFKKRNNQLKVFRNNILLWEISEKYFEPGFFVHFKQAGDNYFINAENLRFKQTALLFSLKATIKKQNGNWDCQMQIPEFNANLRGNFDQWLE